MAIPAVAVWAVCLSILELTGASVPLSAQARTNSRPALVIEQRPFFDSGRSVQVDSVVLSEPMGMTRLASGVVVVGDNKSLAVKFFSPSGSFLKSFGRAGAGPGEFQLVKLVGNCGTDSLMVFDGAKSRLSYISLNGDYFGSKRQTLVSSGVSCGRTGMVLEVRSANRSLTQRPSVYRGRVTISVRAFSDSLAKPLLEVVGDDRQRWSSSIGPRPLGRKTVVAVGSDRFFVGTGDSSVVRVFRFSGEELAVIKLPFLAVRVTRKHVDDYIRYLGRRNPGVAEEQLQRTYGSLEYPEMFPSHGAVLVSVNDQLWVEQYRLPGKTQSTWAVFDRGGTPIHIVTLPDGLRLAEVGRDYLLGSWRDANDVDHVRAYRFTLR